MMMRLASTLYWIADFLMSMKLDMSGEQKTSGLKRTCVSYSSQSHCSTQRRARGKFSSSTVNFLPKGAQKC